MRGTECPPSASVKNVLDLGIDLNLWPWVWLIIGVAFVAVELTLLAGAFVLLPFAISAFAAALLGFYDVAIEVQWAVFIAGGSLLWVLLYKRVMKFAGESDLAPGVGADRLVGMSAIVTNDIDPDDTERRGRVKVEGEVWSALTNTATLIRQGTKVRISEIQGTRVLVTPVDAHDVTPPIGPPTMTPPPPPNTHPDSGNPS